MNEKKIISSIALLICMGLVILFLSGCTEEEKNHRPLSIDQTTCPVTGLPIDKNISSVYSGQTVYFSSQEAKNTFDKNPGKYFSNPPSLRQ